MDREAYEQAKRVEHTIVALEEIRIALVIEVSNRQLKNDADTVLIDYHALKMSFCSYIDKAKADLQKQFDAI